MNPSLFVFPYDWRQDNAAVSAVKLKAYVDCVREFYPNKDVKILAHSQGGLVGSRYIFQHPKDHHISKFISIATPFLGAPKAIDYLETGGNWRDDREFSFGVVSPPEIRFLAESFASVHQLLPSRRYFDLQDYVFTESGDFNNNGIANENYNYDQFKSFLDPGIASLLLKQEENFMTHNPARILTRTTGTV